MPQMSPLNWLFLYIYFITMITLIISFIYFMYLLSSNSSINKKFTFNMNWMW